LSPQPNKLDTLNEAILRSIKKITDKKENESIVGSPAKSIKSNNTDFVIVNNILINIKIG